jgi:predicted enzyme related to lactoylglutathione lyase
MGQFYSKVAGVTASNPDGNDRQKYIRAFCKSGMELILRREADNKFDSNAVAVWINAKALIFFSSEVQIGYLNADIAGEISRHLDNGGHVEAKIKEVTGGNKGKKSLGVNILINKY